MVSYLNYNHCTCVINIATYADAQFALDNKYNLSNLNKSEESIRKMLRKKRREGAKKKYDGYIVDGDEQNKENAEKQNKKLAKKELKKKSKKVEEKSGHELDDTVICEYNDMITIIK